jgi:hypothetical protein
MPIFAISGSLPTFPALRIILNIGFVKDGNLVKSSRKGAKAQRKAECGEFPGNSLRLCAFA